MEAAKTLLALAVIALLSIPALHGGSTTWHLDGEYNGGEEYEGYEQEYEGRLGGLGEAAYAGAILLTLQLLAGKYLLRRLTPEIIDARLYSRIYRLQLDLHSYGNLAAAALAGMHGLANLQTATLLEYAMATLIAALTASGILLRYSRNRRLKLYARLLHGQRILALALLALATIHAETRD